VDILFHSTSGDPAAWLAALARHLPDARIHRPPTPVAADYALVWKPPPEVFAGQTRLKAVFNIGAGVDAVVDNAGLPTGVPLVRLEDAGMARQMADYVTWGVLGHFREFPVYAQQAARPEWKPRPPRARECFGVGVLGLGVLGTAVLDALRPFGFALSGWSRTPRSLPGIRTFAGPEAFHAFLAGCDVLVCLLPLTASTRGLLDAAAFGALPPGALFVNVARGGVVSEDDLLAALDRGHLAGALLDVFRDEPLPDAHPFWRHPGVTVTPHVSAATLVDESIAQIAAKIRQLELGEAVTGVVDRARGY
jgi:glyoxylate/hydroxypyruvate reductase A